MFKTKYLKRSHATNMNKIPTDINIIINKNLNSLGINSYSLVSQSRTHIKIGIPK